jgi:hypothetical protein
MCYDEIFVWRKGKENKRIVANRERDGPLDAGEVNF